MLKEEKENQRNMVIMLVLILAIFMVPRFFMEKKTETVNVPLTTTEEVVAAPEPVQAEAEKPEAIIQPAAGVQLPIENSFVSGALTSDGTRISELN